jgi:3',5'-cyclic AMP phosphodiesterase CpdA
MMIMRYLLLILISISLQAAEPLFFIQMADPQLGMFGKNENSIQEEANLSFVVANINRLKPTFVVVCGDLVNKTGDSAQIRSYKQIIKNVEKDIPVYNVPGNHDVGNQPAREQLARYREAFGKDYYTFDAGPLRGIVLNSSLIGSPQNAPEEAAAQEKWLLSELARARRDRIENLVVFQHISYFLKDPTEPDQYFNIPQATRRRYLQWFHEYGVKHIFAGHYHRNEYGRDEEIEMVTTGPVGMPLGKNQSGFRIVRLAQNGMENRYYELGSIPNVIDAGRALPEWPAPAKSTPSN